MYCVNIGLTVDTTIDPTVKITGQPVSRTQASDAITSLLSGSIWLPRYEAVCATHVLPMGVGPLAFRYQGNGATPCQYIDTTRKAIDCATTLPLTVFITRRPASADSTARRQFQATGQPVSRTQASDAMTSRLPRYESKCVQRRYFQCGLSLCVQISRERSYPSQ